MEIETQTTTLYSLWIPHLGGAGRREKRKYRTINGLIDGIAQAIAARLQLRRDAHMGLDPGDPGYLRNHVYKYPEYHVKARRRVRRIFKAHDLI